MKKGSSFNSRTAGLHPANEGATPSGSTNSVNVRMTYGSAAGNQYPLGTVMEGDGAVTVHLRVPERLADFLQIHPGGPCSMCGAPDYDGYGHPAGGWVKAWTEKSKDWCVGPAVKTREFAWETQTANGPKLWTVKSWSLPGKRDQHIWHGQAWVKEKENGKKNGRKKSK